MKSVQGKSWAILFACLIFYSCKKQDLPNSLVSENIPTHTLDVEHDLDVLLQQIGNSRIVLLGEASHGTAEYYQWRAAISKRLIQEKGFDFVASESEWADSYRVNNFIKGERKDSTAVLELLKQYDRWPSWMWGNHEIASLVTWLNYYNQDKPAKEWLVPTSVAMHLWARSWIK